MQGFSFPRYIFFFLLYRNKKEKYVIIDRNESEFHLGKNKKEKIFVLSIEQNSIVCYGNYRNYNVVYDILS